MRGEQIRLGGERPKRIDLDAGDRGGLREWLEYVVETAIAALDYLDEPFTDLEDGDDEGAR
jgi:hypothetical protein